MDNINNNNIADSNQSNVNTNPVNTYNSMQPSSPLMGNTNVNGTEPNDNMVEDLSATPSVASSSTPVEELPSQEPISDIQNISAVSGSEYNTNVVEDLSGVEPVAPIDTPVDGLPSQEPISQTVSNNVQDISGQPQMPSFGSIPVMGESISSSFVPEQPSLTQEAVQTNSIDMSAPLSQPISSTLETSNISEQSVPSFGSAVQQPQAELSANSSMQTSTETPSAPAFSETEIINTFGSEKNEKKGGNTVVVILIVVIVVLLLAIGYFAYKVFFV